MRKYYIFVDGEKISRGNFQKHLSIMIEEEDGITRRISYED